MKYMSWSTSQLKKKVFCSNCQSEDACHMEPEYIKWFCNLRINCLSFASSKEFSVEKKIK